MQTDRTRNVPRLPCPRSRVPSRPSPSRSPHPLPRDPSQSPRRAGRRSHTGQRRDLHPVSRSTRHWEGHPGGKTGPSPPRPLGHGGLTGVSAPPGAEGSPLFSLDHQTGHRTPSSWSRQTTCPTQRPHWASGKRRAHRGPGTSHSISTPQQRAPSPSCFPWGNRGWRGAAACRRSWATEVGTVPEP